MATFTFANAQDGIPIQEQHHLFKISDLSTVSSAIINTIRDKDQRTRYYGIGFHYERLLTNRLSVETRGVYYRRVSLITTRSGSQPPVTVRGEEVKGITLSTGIRSYFRKNKLNHYNGFFTGGYIAYSYQNVNTINHYNIIHLGIPVGYQHKFLDKLTLEVETSAGYGLWATYEGRPPGGPVTVYNPVRKFIAAHIALGYIF